MTKVLVFDIDGTLADTTAVDGEFFKRAIVAALPEVALESFDAFMEMTDSAILRDICAQLGCPDFGAVQGRVLEHFVEGLARARESDAAAFRPIAGAAAILGAARRVGWTPAIATGGWRPSAELKLDAARIPAGGVPLATSSERDRRVDIIRLAVEEATLGTEPDAVVYVGDGSWDVAACQELGIGFIGRAQGHQAERLKDLGARCVVPDFSDADSVLGTLRDPEALRPG